VLTIHHDCFTWEVKVLLAWRSHELRDVCGSEAALATRWPASASAAQDLLWAVAHAETLGSLMRLRCIRVGILDDGGRAAAVFQLEEVSMHASVLNKSGQRLPAVVPASVRTELGSATALLINDVQANGLGLVRAAG
jgi:hypothetical protein